MRTEIENKGPQINSSDIDEIELDIGVKLPKEYRDFLLSNNGGQPWPDVIDITSLSNSPVDVSVILGISREVKSSNLAWAMGTYSDFVRSGHLPVALDSGGNLYVLHLRDEGYGSVSYVDLSDDKAISYYVADSFETFLNKLREF